MHTTALRPALNAIYPISFFTGSPTALLDIAAQQIAIFECDSDTGAHILYDIIAAPYNLSIPNYSSYICVGLLSPAYPYTLAP